MKPRVRYRQGVGFFKVWTILLGHHVPGINLAMSEAQTYLIGPYATLAEAALA